MNNIINVKDSNNNKSIINNDMADSTMYGIWDHTLPARTVHIDMDSIVGGKVRDMTRALIKNYLHLPNRLEVIVIAGINNIGAGERADDIIKEMEVFKQVVADHNKKWKHSPLSFTDICIVARGSGPQVLLSHCATKSSGARDCCVGTATPFTD